MASSEQNGRQDGDTRPCVECNGNQIWNGRRNMWECNSCNTQSVPV